MKFFFPSLLILFINFFSTFSFSKELDVGVHKVIFPNKLNIINWNETIYSSAFCKEFSNCFGFVDDKALDIIEQLNTGKNYEDIKLIQPIIKKYNKMLNSFSESNFKSLMKTTKSILKKNKSGTIYTYMRSEEKITESDFFNDYEIEIDEIRKMNKSGLKSYSKKLKKEITSGKGYYMFMDGLFVNFDKFLISKNSNNIPYLIFNGEITYLLGSSKTKLGRMVYYVSEINNNLFILDGFCIVNCKSFFSDFDNIINKSFNNSIQKTSKINSNDENSNIVEQFEQLNSLYKSGVLTKEEFEKAKKKILN